MSKCAFVDEDFYFSSRISSTHRGGEDRKIGVSFQAPSEIASTWSCGPSVGYVPATLPVSNTGVLGPRNPNPLLGNTKQLSPDQSVGTQFSILIFVDTVDADRRLTRFSRRLHPRLKHPRDGVPC